MFHKVHDQKTMDGNLAYYINQLTNLDKKLYEPLVSIQWSRDIKLRTGVTLANESTAFTRTSFAAMGGMSSGSNATGGGKSWISPNSRNIQGVGVNGELVTTPLRIWGAEVSYTSIELDRSQLLGQQIDVSKFNALNLKYQMDIDEMVYVGDTELSVKGMFNSSLVTTGNVPNGASLSPLWTSKTPDEILKDVNTLIQNAWGATGFAICPSELRLPPAQFAYISSQKVSTAGNVSILTFLEENSISLRVNGTKLNIQPSKWLTGRGAGSTDRMVTYTNDEDRLRFSLAPIRREMAYYQGINFISPYIAGLGEVEFVYPETVQYADGI